VRWPVGIYAVAFVVALLIAFVYIWLASPPPGHAEELWTEDVRVTYYLPTGNAMRDGTMPYVGAAACGAYFPMGTQLVFEDGFQVECRDTGYLGRYQVDVFAPSRAWGLGNIEAVYGLHATVSVARWGRQ
jgi:hypothetical protein